MEKRKENRVLGHEIILSEEIFWENQVPSLFEKFPKITGSRTRFWSTKLPVLRKLSECFRFRFPFWKAIFRKSLQIPLGFLTHFFSRT